MTEFVRLRDILHVSTEGAVLSDHLLYSQLMALPNCGGIVVKTMLRGADFSGKPQSMAGADQFMIARVHLQKGMWGMIPAGLDQAVVPYSYHVFDLSPQVIPNYFAAYVQTPIFAHAVFEAARRSGRLYLRSFGAIPIWLPTYEEQERVIALLRAGQEALAQTQMMLDSVEQIKQSAAADLFAQVNPAWEASTLGACAVVTHKGYERYPLVVTEDGRLLQDAWLQAGGIGITPHAELSRDFLILWLETTLPRLSSPLAALETQPLMLPTLYEQQKITSVLLAHDRAIHTLQVEQAALNQLLISVRNTIFSGDTELPRNR